MLTMLPTGLASPGEAVGRIYEDASVNALAGLRFGRVHSDAHVTSRHAPTLDGVKAEFQRSWTILGVTRKPPVVKTRLNEGRSQMGRERAGSNLAERHEFRDV